MGEWRQRPSQRGLGAARNGPNAIGAAEARLAAETHHHAGAVGWRGVWLARVHRMGGEAHGGAGAQRSGLHQLRFHWPRFAGVGRLGFARTVCERGPARRHRSCDIQEPAGSGTSTPGGFRTGKRWDDFPARAPGAGVSSGVTGIGFGLCGISGSRGHCQLELSASAPATASTIPSTTRPPGISSFQTEIARTARLSPR